MTRWYVDRLLEVQDELERNGAVVARVPASTLTDDQARLLFETEARRLRVLAEAHAPGPAPLSVRGSALVDLVRVVSTLVREDA